VAIKNRKGEWICSYCKQVYPDPAAADSCREGHNLVYVAITKKELNHLLNFIYTGEEELIPPGLITRLKSYLRSK